MSKDATSPQTTDFTVHPVRRWQPGKFSFGWVRSIRLRALGVGVLSAVALLLANHAIDNLFDPASVPAQRVDGAMTVAGAETTLHLLEWTQPKATWAGTLWLLLRTTAALLACAVFGSFICRDLTITLATERSPSLREVFRFTIPRTLHFWLAPMIAVAIAVLLQGIASVASLLASVPVVGSPIGTGVSAIVFWLCCLVLGLTAFAWPLMIAVQSIEGCDCFDGFSRGLNFVLSRPVSFALMLVSLVVFGIGPSWAVGIGLSSVLESQIVQVIQGGYFHDGAVHLVFGGVQRTAIPGRRHRAGRDLHSLYR